MAYSHRDCRDGDPDKSGLLFNYLRKRYNLKTETSLAVWLGVHNSALSKIRHGIHEVPAALILRVYDRSDLSIEDIRQLIAEGAVSNQDPMLQRNITPRRPNVYRTGRR